MEELVKYLATLPTGIIKKAVDLVRHLGPAWPMFDGDDSGGYGDKLHGRRGPIERERPSLRFVIERLGAMQFGLTRAEPQLWFIGLFCWPLARLGRHYETLLIWEPLMEPLTWLALRLWG